MRNILTIFAFVLVTCLIPSFSEAQNKSLVTDAMARKVAYSAKYGTERVRIHIYDDFCNGNDTRYSAYEYDKILENILSNKDKIEKFICQVCYGWGTDDMGYSYFKTIGFTVAEFDIAVNIYNNWRKAKEKRERQEEEQRKKQQIINDRDTLASWERHGKPIFNIGDNNVSAPTFLIPVEGYGDSPIIDPSMQMPQDRGSASGTLRHYQRTYNYMCRDEVTANELYYFVVDEENKNLEKNTRFFQMSNSDFWEFDLDSTNALFDQFDVIILAPGTYTFTGLDTTISVPTRNVLRIVEIHRKIEFNSPELENEFTKLEVVVTKDKDTQLWSLEPSNKKMARRLLGQFQNNQWEKTRNWLLGVENVDEFIEMLTAQINSKLQDNNHKKCKIALTMIGCGERYYYINKYKLDEYTNVPFEARIDNIEIIK